MICRLRTLILRLLHIPLLYKVILVNWVVTVVLVVAGAILAVQPVQTQPAHDHSDFVSLFLGVSIVVISAVDFLLMRAVLALTPVALRFHFSGKQTTFFTSAYTQT